ncbi:hypothetical protein BC830DRAFT_1115300 [Chytriomyces sp. MP71]|nr:hypothetical protein BC830DRAFT_1115300 [Chytriomyces sp. MP71]
MMASVTAMSSSSSNGSDGFDGDACVANAVVVAADSAPPFPSVTPIRAGAVTMSSTYAADSGTVDAAEGQEGTVARETGRRGSLIGVAAIPSPPQSPAHVNSLREGVSIRPPSVYFSDSDPDAETEELVMHPALSPDEASASTSDAHNHQEIPQYSQEEEEKEEEVQENQHLANSSSQSSRVPDNIAALPDALVSSPALAAQFSACLNVRIQSLRMLVLDVDGAPIVPIDHLRLRMRLGAVLSTPQQQRRRRRNIGGAPLSANPAADTATSVLNALQRAENDESENGSEEREHGPSEDDQVQQARSFEQDNESGDDNATFEQESEDQDVDYSSDDSDNESRDSLSLPRAVHSIHCPHHWPHNRPEQASELGPYSIHRGPITPLPSSLETTTAFETPVTLGPTPNVPTSITFIYCDNTPRSRITCSCILCTHEATPPSTLTALLEAEQVAHTQDQIHAEQALCESDLDACLQLYRDQKPGGASRGHFFRSTAAPAVEAVWEADPGVAHAWCVMRPRRRLAAWEDRFSEFVRAHRYTTAADSRRRQGSVQRGGPARRGIMGRATNETPPEDGVVEDVPVGKGEDEDVLIVAGRSGDVGGSSSSTSSSSSLTVSGTDADEHCGACEALALRRVLRRRLRRVRRRRRFGMVGEVAFEHDGALEEGDEGVDDQDVGEDEFADAEEGVDGDDQEEDLFEEFEYGGDGDVNNADAEDSDDESEEISEEYSEGDEAEGEDADPESDKEDEADSEMDDDEREEAFLDDYTNKIQELIGLQEVVWRLEQVAFACR